MDPQRMQQAADDMETAAAAERQRRADLAMTQVALRLGIPAREWMALTRDEKLTVLDAATRRRVA